MDAILNQIDDIIESNWTERLKENIALDDYNQVFPGILLGDRKLSSDIEGLKKLNVTHVINTAMGKGSDQIDTNAALFEGTGIKFMGVNASDNPSCKLETHFTEVAQYIHTALNDGGRVFVHCMLGMSRSTSFVLAYLLIKQEMDLIEAIKLLQTNRPMDPNKGFLSELYDLNVQLKLGR